MSFYGEEDIELFSVNYDFDANSTVNSEDLGGLINFRALAVEGPQLFVPWGLRENYDTFTTANVVDIHQSASGAEQLESSSRSFGFDEPPFGLPSASQFVVDGSKDIVGSVDEYLNHSAATSDFDFSFSNDIHTVSYFRIYSIYDPTSYDFYFIHHHEQWRGKCLLGASCLEVEVRIYFKQATKEFVVAVLKMRGSEPNSVSFMDFFFRLRENLTGERAAKRRKIDPSAFKYSSQSLPAPSNEEFLQGAAPMLKMASDECFDVRLEAAKMMCDISTKSTTYLELPEFRIMCLNILEQLIQDPFDDVRQHAVMALAAFAELVTYQDAILVTESMVLPVLFGTIDNVSDHATNSWRTVKVRRTAASIVLMLCIRNASAVSDQLQRVYGIDIMAWRSELVPALLDSKTKSFAEEISLFLQQQKSVGQHTTLCTEGYHNGVASVA